MKRSLLQLTFFLAVYAATYCPKAPSTPGDRRKDLTKVTIATYNAEWLFLGDDGSSDCPGEGCAWKTSKDADLHMKYVAEVIKALDADILNLAEVRSCGVLQRLNALLPTMKYVPYMISGSDMGTYQNVGLLTRIDPSEDLKKTNARVEYPIRGSTCGVTNPEPGDTTVSKHYYTTFDIPKLPKTLGFIGAHLVAFPTNKDRCLQREAQATVLADLADSQLSGMYQIITGDFNDFDPTVTDTGGNVPISSALQIMRGNTKRINIASKIKEQAQRYSYWYDANRNCQVQSKELNMIDHMLVSKDLAAKVTKTELFHYNDAACGAMYSDHWPLKITIDLSKSTKEDEMFEEDAFNATISKW